MDAFNWERDYPEYTRLSTGADIRLSHPLRWKFTRAFWMYRFENVKLSNLQPDASPVLQEAATIHNTSAHSLSIRRDSRDSTFAPTRGTDHSISIEMAGLGGQVGYMRYVADAAYYYPLWWGMVAVFHARGGYMQQTWAALPCYEKFYLGGIDSIRGFKFADISPRDPNTGDRIGGDKFSQLNTEIRFPLYKKLGLMGTLFFDAGNVYGHDMINPALRTSAGTGIRWFSPMGPLRVEWGLNLFPKNGEKRSVWEFTMGGQF
jgi:outer membrane protein insertion porin family